jgi:hypothetical protein
MLALEIKLVLKQNFVTPMANNCTKILTSCFGLMADSAVVDSALVDATLRKFGII